MSKGHVGEQSHTLGDRLIGSTPKGPYPSLASFLALRQVDDTCYMMDSRSGKYYQIDKNQLAVLRLADGAHPLHWIASETGVDAGDALLFFEEQERKGYARLGLAPSGSQVPHFRKCAGPHLSDVLVEITGFCNLTCRHCFNAEFNTPAALAREMTLAQRLLLIGQLDDLNCRRIQLSGGEALTYDGLWDVIQAIDEHRIFLDVISTNATLVNEKNVDRFASRFREHGALYISMDGLTGDTYDLIRGDGVFGGFKHALTLLTDAGCRVFLNTMAIRQNLGQLLDMYEWIKSKPSIQGWRIGLPKVLGRYQSNHKHLEIEFTEVIEVFKQILKRWMADRPHFRLELSDFFRTDSLETGLEDHSLGDHPCKYALTNCTIKPDGKVVFCASLEVYPDAVLGNAVSQGLADVWYGDAHKRIRAARLDDLAACRKCRYRRICGGGCRSNALLSYEDFRAADPRACVAMNMLEHEILPLLPQSYAEQVCSLIEPEAAFSLPTGHRKYI